MFQIEAYEDMSLLFEGELEKDALHLAGDGAQAQYLKEEKKVYVSTNEQLMSYLFSTWQHTFMDLKLKSEIKQRIIQHTEENSNLRKQFLSQSKELMIALRFLADLDGVKLYEQEHDEEETRLFRLIMNDLLDLAEVQDYTETRLNLSIMDVLGAFSVRDQTSVNGIIYVYMQDFIDLSRMKFYYLLTKLGFKLTFRIPFNSMYPNLHSGWKEVYQAVSPTGFASRTMVKGINATKGKAFAQKIEGIKPDKSVESGISLTYYDHPNELKRELITHPLQKKQREMVAADAEGLSELILDQEELFLLSTKVGRFLKYLLKCKHIANDIELSYSTFCELITSGWLGEQGVAAYSLLIDLESYIGRVSTLSEIEDRLFQLIELQELSSDFEKEARDAIGRSRVKRYLSNPFRVLPLVHRHRYECTPKQLVDLHSKLKKMLNDLLLPENEFIKVNDYIARLQAIYSESNMKINDEVKARFEERCLHPIEQEDWKFPMEEIILLLAARFAPDKNKRNNEDYDDDATAKRIQSIGNAGSKSMISSHLHITQLSAQKFPRVPLHLPVYLDYTWLKQSIKHSQTDSQATENIHSLLVDFHSRRSARAFDVYALYSALAFRLGEVTFSWIDQTAEHDSPSVYYQFLEECYGEAVQPNVENDIELDWPEEIELEKKSPSQLLDDVPALYWLDVDYCGRKFFYNAILSNQPVYESDFHQQLVFGIIGSLLSQQGEGRNQVEEVLFPLFPQWTSTQKANLIDTEFNYPLRNNHATYENIQYPKALEKLQNLRGQSRRKAYKKSFRNETLNTTSATKTWLKKVNAYDVAADSGDHCKMCPHIYRCSEGRFAVQDD
ncbi:hypothetical protein M3689_17850 [Alkalihalophilus marmarensis]|uniref:hypothetical protein n=1 Tax=Alkalihalophilus marmarensis TaxID=521377 RepID=UPI00203EE530|nr:hypothetical protein [Alkalihalophilus marmarensis]MCM3491167.1 hypothetical protein [Alkalihalophilus marmarensis]